MKRRVDFGKCFFIHHEKFSGERMLVLFYKQKGDDVTNCVTEGTCNNGRGKK